MPWVLGANVAGEVVELGSGVSKVKVGDHVFGMEDIASPTPDQGGLQEYALLNEDALAKVPAGFTDDQVVTLPINVVTAFMAFFTKFGFDFPAPWTAEAKSYDFASEHVIVVGAGSNVAKLGVQYAKQVGIGKIICLAGPANEQELKSYGATHFIDRHGSNEEVAAQIDAIVGKDNALKIYDCYSWTYELPLEILSSTKPTRLVTLHSLKPEHLEMIKTRRPLAKASFIPCSNPGLAPYTAQYWDQLAIALQEKTIFPTPFQTIEGLDVDKINAALDVYWSAKAQKQFIIHP